MNILAIDTSSEYLSLALQCDATQVFTLEKVGNKQSNHIIPSINELLVSKKISVNDIDIIAYNQGPGSFTGLRIGLSVALGLCLGANAKIVAIPAFAIYAQNIIDVLNVDKILIGLDARLSQIYLAGLDLKTFKYFLEPRVVNPNEININDTRCVGSGFKEYYDLLPEKIQRICDLNVEYPNALNMLQLVNQKRYAPISILDADLLYLRNKVALTTQEQIMAKGLK